MKNTKVSPLATTFPNPGIPKPARQRSIWAWRLFDSILLQTSVHLQCHTGLTRLVLIATFLVSGYLWKQTLHHLWGKMLEIVLLFLSIYQHLMNGIPYSVSGAHTESQIQKTANYYVIKGGEEGLGGTSYSFFPNIWRPIRYKWSTRI